MSYSEMYMKRCLELARRGAGQVSPNPLVGAVLVSGGRILGEGWHARFGEAHAEVNCLNDAISRGFEKQLEVSTLYVSLEPCVHHGKTPPCVNLILDYKIPRVVIGCSDPFDQVNGRGIAKLQLAGVETIVGVLEEECRELNKRFFSFHTRQRPYVILKWAQTKDGVAGLAHSRLLVSNEYTNRLVHKWRSREDAILVGTQTALRDDPELTTRLWPGPSPQRLVVDLELKLPPGLKLFRGEKPAIIFNHIKHDLSGNPPALYYRVERGDDMIQQLLAALYQLKIQAVIVEGGPKLLQSFIDAGAWDEARVIFSETSLGNTRGAVMAPRTGKIKLKDQYAMGPDKIQVLVPG